MYWKKDILVKDLLIPNPTDSETPLKRSEVDQAIVVAVSEKIDQVKPGDRVLFGLGKGQPYCDQFYIYENMHIEDLYELGGEFRVIEDCDLMYVFDDQIDVSEILSKFIAGIKAV